MRILYFYQYFTVPAGSYSTRCYEMARRWARAGDQVTMVTSVYDKSGLTPTGLIDRRTIEGIDVRIINLRLSNKHPAPLRILTFFAFALVACWYAVVTRADVILSSSGPITTGLPGLVGHYLRGRPFVFEVRDLWPEGAIQLGILRNRTAAALARWFETRCYRAASLVVALSEGMAESIAERHPGTALLVIPNASDPALFGRPAAGPEPTVEPGLVLYTGTIGFADDCGQIVDAARVLQARGRTDVRIVMIGDGNERGLLEARAREAGLANIEFRGLVPKTDLPGWLHRADCALLTIRDVPVMSTCSPNKMFDAFAAGVPVVHTTRGWIRRLFEREGGGITVPPNDPEAFADALIRLTEDRALRDRLSGEARRLARERFDRDGLATAMRAGLARAAGLG
ncbi:MAG: glycosyltransferase family 4 protein [Gemmatimonadetes bacterium]|nr:glycosyltransferase family 4 protein [Gemmatimonadota bacterium]